MSTRPTAAVLGPSNLDRVAAAAGLPAAHLAQTAAAVGAMVARAGHILVVVPDRGVAVLAAEAYRAAGGDHVIGIAPSRGECHPDAAASLARNVHLCDEVHDSLSWYEQHHWIGRVSDRMVAVGMSCGTLAELAWTKWTPGPPVAMVAGTSSPVPPELLAEADVEVLPLSGIEAWLSAGPAPVDRQARAS